MPVFLHHFSAIKPSTHRQDDHFFILITLGALIAKLKITIYFTVLFFLG